MKEMMNENKTKWRRRKGFSWEIKGAKLNNIVEKEV